VRPRCKGRKLAGRPKGEGGRCGERAVCEELGETKWTDNADGDDMESMSPGLIHGKTACEKASRGTAGEETPKNLSEPAISRRANVANQEEWFGQIPIPLVPRRGIGDTTTLARRSMVLSPGANLGPVTVPSGATFQPVGLACSMPQNEYETNWPGSLGGGIEPTWCPHQHRKTLGWLPLAFVKNDTTMDGWQNRCEACDLCRTN
jgi:hypothetical protein